MKHGLSLVLDVQVNPPELKAPKYVKTVLVPILASAHPSLCPQAPAAASELCQLRGKPQLGADDASCPGCRAVHVRGAYSEALLEQPAEAWRALPAGSAPGGSSRPSQTLQF